MAQDSPSRDSFAMTINKSQGQSLNVGLNLEQPVFTHGQLYMLYVGCSRVGLSNNLHILSPQTDVKNIVYQEALR
jgi:ATP-dependent DNA helicase PIF1